jgi:hypothetical protein
MAIVWAFLAMPGVAQAGEPLQSRGRFQHTKATYESEPLSCTHETSVPGRAVLVLMAALTLTIFICCQSSIVWRMPIT